MATYKALIAVRSGSTRVKNKNLRPFANTNLLALKIKQLQDVPELDGVVVNSNDPEMLEVAKSMGCETVKRDPYYASNTVCMSDVYENMASNIDTDYIVYANCTNPLLKTETISEAIRVFKSVSGKYDSLNSAHLIKEFLFNNGVPVNYDLAHQPRSQDLPDLYALNFAINIISKKDMIECKNVVGKHPYIFGTDEVEGTDIDNPIDFDFAEFVYKKNYLGL